MSSLNTFSSREDEFSSDVFGQGGNEVNNGGITSFSDGNSRKTAIGDGGMKRKMKELSILTVVNITVTMALISFITNENARIINAELESLKKFVGKMEQQHGNAESLSQLRNDHAQHQQKEFCTKNFEAEDENRKLKNDHKEMEEKVVKLEEQLDAKAFQEELEKKVMERIVAMQTKVDKMEMGQQQQKVVVSELEGQQKYQKQQWEKETNALVDQIKQLRDELKNYLEKVNELEKQHKQLQQEKSAFLQSQNDQKKILEKIIVLEKQTQKKVLLKFQENYWDVNFCDENLQISGDKSLTVHHKGKYNGYWHSVFAKYPIVLNKPLSDFFYYEISVMEKGNEKYWPISFGFAVKQQNKLYAYESYGDIWMNGGKRINAQYSYGVGDTVGIGVHLASRQLIFTKNGLRLDNSDFLVDPSFAYGSFYPFVSLAYSGDKIEANFGPNFKFDLETL